MDASTVFPPRDHGQRRALGMAQSIGSLTAGKKADITIIDRHSAHMAPLRNPLQNTVYYANGGDVRTVIVDGRIIVQDGAVKTVDEDEAVTRPSRPPSRSGRTSSSRGDGLRGDGGSGVSRSPIGVK